MELPIQITFRSIAHSDAVEFAIRQRAARLDRFCDEIQRCHVTVDMPHGHHHRGNHYAIHIDIVTPAGEICVTRDPSLDDSHKDFQAVIRDAFDAATRQLQAEVQRLRGDVKDHAHAPPRGRVDRLFPRDGYGFVVTGDGREIYFHENSVVDERFDHLIVGSEVRFTVAPDDSDQGSRAASVQLVSGRPAAGTASERHASQGSR
jgi:cold shock CspA family protein/ribosome-associated translation inhibitor RaiA